MRSIIDAATMAKSCTLVPSCLNSHFTQFTVSIHTSPNSHFTQFTVSIHLPQFTCLNSLSQVLIHLSQFTCSIHCLNSLSQFTVSIHLPQFTIHLSQFTVSIHPPPISIHLSQFSVSLHKSPVSIHCLWVMLQTWIKSCHAGEQSHVTHVNYSVRCHHFLDVRDP